MDQNLVWVIATIASNHSIPNCDTLFIETMFVAC